MASATTVMAGAALSFFDEAGLVWPAAFATRLAGVDAPSSTFGLEKRRT